VPLTRVALAYIEPRFKLYLRFGEPARTLQLDRWRAARCSCRRGSLPHPLAGQRLRHDPLAAHGDAGRTPLDAAQRIPGVQPGARLLLHAEGDANVRAVLERIDGIEALGIAAADVSPAYWRTLGNRLAARWRCPNTPPSGTPPGWPGGRCHDHDFHDRPRAASSLAPARSPRAGGLRRCRPRCAGLGGVRAAAAAPGLQPVRQRGGRLVSHRTVRPRTASLPRPLSVDSIVLVPLPDRAALAAQRGYLPTAFRCSNVGAVAPQHVCIVAGQVRIDGVPVAAACLPTGWAGRCHPCSFAAASNRANCSC
jgi:hypothetical protein